QCYFRFNTSCSCFTITVNPSSRVSFLQQLFWVEFKNVLVCFVSPPDETWVGVYTLKDCYPVQETYAKNSSVTTSTRFFNLQLGISDPDVFTPPGTCQSARPERMSESDC
ncbi:mammalian ependymin-related protein 1-like, partial [Anarrhichthys ocellatus]|uniref:mammalian ependymin-related protein 1-like n=1 Tax=Anarrhichthys ocellatus TaxID=433405 RepID=UPI0012ECF51B